MKKKILLHCDNCGAKPDSIFCRLDHRALAQMEREKNTNIYQRGQTLFLAGNPPFGIYCVNSGKIKLSRMGERGKETIVRIAAAGDLLGHRSLFSETPYSLSATVIEEAKLCFISKATILGLIKANPELSFEILNRISEQMGAAEARIASFAQKSVRERFAELLLLLNESFGKRMEKNTLLDIRLSREEMASIVGAAPENIIRLITEFRNEGLIEPQGKAIHLINIPKLEMVAHLDE